MGGCHFDDPGDTHFDVTFDPCAPVVLVPAADASEAEIEGIRAAIDMWHAVVPVKLQLEDLADARRLPIVFEDAPLLYYGLYEDETGRILINRRLTDDLARAVTIAHELGHAFGLYHVSPEERPSVMNNGNLEIPPTLIDAQQILSLYEDCSP